jgi:pilus assembly protein Flp/PilA
MRLRSLAADESGATAIEYGLIASLIAIAIIAGVSAVGTDVNALFISIGSAIPTS